jgi:hypothetical protein
MQPFVTVGHTRRESADGVGVDDVELDGLDSGAGSESSKAAAWPMPDEAPVTTTTRPVRSAGGGQCSRRDRAA